MSTGVGCLPLQYSNSRSFPSNFSFSLSCGMYFVKMLAGPTCNGYSNIQKQKSKGFCYQILKWLQLVGVCWKLDISNKNHPKRNKTKKLGQGCSLQSLKGGQNLHPISNIQIILCGGTEECKNFKPSKLLTHILFLALHAINQKRYFIVLHGKQQKTRIMLRDIWHLVSKKPLR